MRTMSNALFGLAFGDTLGATAEFTRPGDTDHTNMIGGGMFDWRPGQWTDDTDQTMMVARAVISWGDPSRIARDVRTQLDGWLDSDPRDVGHTTRWGIENPGKGLMDSEANGSLMRTLPLAAITDGLIRHASVRSVSQITHPNRRCIRVCQGYVELVWMMLTVDVFCYRPVGPAVSLDECPFPTDGDVLRSLWIALWAVGEMNHRGHEAAEEILLEIVHAGGDADTHAAIAGGLMGAYGAPWPDRWYEQIEGREQIADTGANLDQLIQSNEDQRNRL